MGKKIYSVDRERASNCKLRKKGETRKSSSRRVNIQGLDIEALIEGSENIEPEQRE